MQLYTGHRLACGMVVKCPNIAARYSARRSNWKKFRLASSSRAATQLRIYGKAQYYRDKPDSERKFDELIEEDEYS